MQDLFMYMMQYYGMREIPGPEHEKIILDMFKEMGYSGITNDETAWCALILNYCCTQKGYENPGTLLARDWLKCGQVIWKPKMGDVVVFWRINPDSKWGHVGLWVSKRNNLIYTLAGNQGNECNITGYPVSQALGFRRPRRLDEIRN